MGLPSEPERHLDEYGGYFLIRPYARQFLRSMHLAGFELVVFTAGIQEYADWVLDIVDSDKLIDHRLYRQHADREGGVFVKDLSKLGRDLKTTIIVDNVMENFMRQPSNGIKIKSWYDDMEDTCLKELSTVLHQIKVVRKYEDLPRGLRDVIGGD